jgi:uncharacterized membrane protein YqjE
MLHPMFRLLATQPGLLADHAEAYAELFGSEFASACERWKRQALFHAAALCSMVVAAVLVGVALMLWAVTPTLQPHAAWVLLLVPLLPALLTWWCLHAARASAATEAFGQLRQQLKADASMLREAAAA